jgi:hypothetical protein
VRGEEEGHVEGRVLPHEDRVEPGERLDGGVPEGGELSRLRADAADGRLRGRAVDEQIFDAAVVLLVAAPLSPRT